MGGKSRTTPTKHLSPVPNDYREYYLYNICTKVWQTLSPEQGEYWIFTITQIHPYLKDVTEQAAEGKV